MTALPITQPRTVTAIFDHLARSRARDHLHPRLSASQLAQCPRLQWDGFRWLFPAEVIDGQKASIFETGEHWEARLVQRLRDAGMTVEDADPATGEQWRVTFAGGHGSGRTDGKVSGVPEAPKTVHVFEAKSHNDKSFKALLKAGSVREGKPEHFAQVQTYLHLQSLTRALYLAVCKNDDSLYAERIEYDATFALALIGRAEALVTSDRRPACGCAPHLLKDGDGCARNEGAFPARTCRSCLHSTAHLDGDARWSCARWNRDLTLDEQKAACPSHLFNPDTVPGEQTDADEAGEWVLYRLADGSVWKDGGV
jgi:hypothetical protein